MNTPPNPLPPHCPSICMYQPGRLHALAHDMTTRLRVEEQCDVVVCLLHGGTDFAGGDEVHTLISVLEWVMIFEE